MGSGKTALVETLSLRLRDHFDMAVITNDIYTQEDAQFLIRRGACPPSAWWAWRRAAARTPPSARTRR